jgi:predicted house-cleaning noncanonical NTP pyrophosphatase (MazG superfamily)
MKHIPTFESFINESVRIRSDKSLDSLSTEELADYLEDVKKYIPTIDSSNKERINKMEEYRVKLGNMLAKKKGEVSGDSNPEGTKHVDTWHQAQHALEAGDKSRAAEMMSKAADQAEELAKEKQDAGYAGEAGYYRGTAAWLKGDWETVEKYANNNYVKSTGNDEVLKRLLKNRDKSYKDAYSTK